MYCYFYHGLEVYIKICTTDFEKSLYPEERGIQWNFSKSWYKFDVHRETVIGMFCNISKRKGSSPFARALTSGIHGIW